MRDFKPMTLANMRQNGVRMIIAACAQCGPLRRRQRRRPVGDPDGPQGRRGGSAAFPAAARQSRPGRRGIRTNGRAFTAIWRERPPVS